MAKIPKFLLYGQDDPNIEEAIQPSLEFRQWSDLVDSEKQIAFQELENNQWLDSYSEEILQTIEYLNCNFLRECPGKKLHSIKPVQNYKGYGNKQERIEAALTDFQHIFLNEKSVAMVFRMLSKFTSCHINRSSYEFAEKSKNNKERDKYITSAFKVFDSLAKCLNHIFEQFAINQVVTRNGFVPRQDEKITNEIYIPTLKVLADPKWKPVSVDLAKMFEDYRDKNYPETITKAHRAVQRFLQILVGKEGKNSKGEMSQLFNKAKKEGIIPVNQFTEPIITVIKSFIPSERATKSTAKPTLKNATASDALLMMNVVMILLQHCLQEITQ